MAAINQVGNALTGLTGTGAFVGANTPTLITPLLGIPTSGTLTNCTGLPVAGLSNLGANVGTFLITPSSANLAAAITDETGTSLLVFNTSPLLVTPKIGQINDTSGNAMMSLSPTASAVNYFLFQNAPASGSPVLSATGSDTDINLDFGAKGAGGFVFLSAATGTVMTIFNGTGYQHTTSFAMANTAANRIITFPDANGTLIAATNVANGSVATILGGLGPVGSHTTVQTWLSFLDPAGVTRYVPCF